MLNYIIDNMILEGVTNFKLPDTMLLLLSLDIINITIKLLQLSWFQGDSNAVYRLIVANPNIYRSLCIKSDACISQMGIFALIVSEVMLY